MRSFTSRKSASVRARFTLSSSKARLPSIRLPRETTNVTTFRLRLAFARGQLARAGRARRGGAARAGRRRAARGVRGGHADRAAAAPRRRLRAGADRQVARLRLRRPAGARARPRRPARRRRRRSRPRPAPATRASRAPDEVLAATGFEPGGVAPFPAPRRRARPARPASCSCTRSSGPAPARRGTSSGSRRPTLARLTNAEAADLAEA